MKALYLGHHANYETLLFDIVGLDRVGIRQNLTGVDQFLLRGFPSFLRRNLVFDLRDLEGSSVSRSKEQRRDQYERFQRVRRRL